MLRKRTYIYMLHEITEASNEYRYAKYDLLHANCG